MKKSQYLHIYFYISQINLVVLARVVNVVISQTSSGAQNADFKLAGYVIILFIFIVIRLVFAKESLMFYFTIPNSSMVYVYVCMYVYTYVRVYFVSCYPKKVSRVRKTILRGLFFDKRLEKPSYLRVNITTNNGICRLASTLESLFTLNNLPKKKRIMP